MHGLDCLDRPVLTSPQHRTQVTTLVSVIVAFDFLNPSVQTLHAFLLLSIVGPPRIVLQIELNLLNGLSEHKLVLGHLYRHPPTVLLKPLVNFNDFLEVQLLEVNVHSADQKVNQVALLKFVISQTAQSL